MPETAGIQRVLHNGEKTGAETRRYDSDNGHRISKGQKCYLTIVFCQVDLFIVVPNQPIRWFYCL